MSIKEIADRIRAHYKDIPDEVSDEKLYDWYQIRISLDKAEKEREEANKATRKRYKETIQLKRRRTMGINKLDNLTRRLNRAMRSILLNSDPDEVGELGKHADIKPDTWEAIGRLLRTEITLHSNYTERVETHDKDYHFNKAFDEKLAQQEKEKEYHDLFSNSGSDEAYMAHVVDGDCLCWHGDIECGATKEERQDILNFRKGFTQDWWEKNS